MGTMAEFPLETQEGFLHWDGPTDYEGAHE